RLGEVELPASPTAREVAVDRADRHFLPGFGDAGPRIDARPARRLEEGRAYLLEEVQVAALFAVALYVLRSALNEEADPRCHPLPSARRLGEDARVHVHVLFLAGRA